MLRNSMYLWLVIVLTLAILPACVFQQPAAPAEAQSEVTEDVEAVTAAVNEIWKQYISSYNAEDIDQWVSLWTDDGVQMPPDSPWVIGKEQIRARNKGFLDQVTVDTFDITNEEVGVAGDWAYARGTFAATFTPRAEGEAIIVDGKYMTILEKQPDGSWKIHRDIFNSNVPPTQE